MHYVPAWHIGGGLTFGNAILSPHPLTDLQTLPLPSPPDLDTRTVAFARVEAFMAAHLPGALGPPILTRTCLYTLTPDRDFVVDRLPDAPGIALATLGAVFGAGARPYWQAWLA